MSNRIVSIEECAVLLKMTVQETLHLIEGGELEVSKDHIQHNLTLNLDNIIKYLRKNAYDNEKNTYTNSVYCQGFDEPDRSIVSTLLDNCKKTFNNGVNNKIFSLDDMLWLTAESWRLCKFKKFVSVQSATSSVMSVFYVTHNDNRAVIESKPIASHYVKIDISCLDGVKFEHVKHSYAKIIADSIDNYIFDKLYESKNHRIEAVAGGYNYNADSDWICGPKKEVDSIIYACDVNRRIEIQDIRTVLNDNLDMKIVCGKYPNILSLPIFCPYVLVSETCRMEPLGLPSFAMRLGWYNED